MRTFVLFGFILFFSPVQSKEYFGFVSVNMTPKNSHTYYVRHKFSIKDENDFETPFVGPTEKSRHMKNRYVFKIIVLEERESDFDSRIEIHEKHYSKDDGVTSYNKIIQFDVKGEFFTKNEYSIEHSGLLNLFMSLELKKKLNKEEMKKIFDKS